MLIFITFALLFLLIGYLVVYKIPLTSNDYDKLLNQLMDDEIPIDFKDAYICKFKDNTFYIWVRNYPYSYGTTYPNEGEMPSMKTRKRLSNYLLTNYQPN